MEFEKLAFKNKTKLSKLDKQDLLAIIEFLQLDRKSWFDQFTKTHNESIAIAKQNQKRKEVIETNKEERGEENITLKTEFLLFILLYPVLENCWTLHCRVKTNTLGSEIPIG